MKAAGTAGEISASGRRVRALSSSGAEPGLRVYAELRGTRLASLTGLLHRERKDAAAVVHEQRAVCRHDRRVHRVAHVDFSDQLLVLRVRHDDDVAVLVAKVDLAI